VSNEDYFQVLRLVLTGSQSGVVVADICEIIGKQSVECRVLAALSI
jgi:hypothetical protein